MAEEGGSHAHINIGERPDSSSRSSSPITQREKDGQVSPREERVMMKVTDIVRDAFEQFRKEEEDKKKGKAESETSGKKVVSFKTFKGCGATEFTGIANPVEALVWVENTEKVFRIAHVAKEDQTVYAAAMFTGKALTWWNNTYKSLGEDERENMSWDAFKARFLEQYCPKDIRRRLEKEFLDIHQGEMTVDEYENVFNQKAQFAIKYVPTEEERIELFVEGLRDEIKDFVANREIPSFNKAIEYARRREHDLVKRKIIASETEQERENRTLVTMTREQSRSVRSKRSSSRPLSRDMTQVGTTRSNTLPSCQRCGKVHEGLCLAEPKCYRCGEIGHTRKSCPKRDHACFTCGDMGHRHFECPYKGQDGNRAPKRSLKKARASSQKEEVHRNENDR